MTQRTHIGWYRGIHSTPVFQILLWGGAAPLIIPFLFLYFRRRRGVREAPFIGNLWSKKVHRQDCKYQIQITSNWNRYPFHTMDEAFKAGYRPCKWCNPSTPSKP